jgi:hypothetical protein
MVDTTNEEPVLSTVINHQTTGGDFINALGVVLWGGFRALLCSVFRRNNARGS